MPRELCPGLACAIPGVWVIPEPPEQSWPWLHCCRKQDARAEMGMLLFLFFPGDTGRVLRVSPGPTPCSDLLSPHQLHPCLSSGCCLGLWCLAQHCTPLLRVVFPAQDLVSQLRTMFCCLGPPCRATFCSRAMSSLAGEAAADPGVKPVVRLNLCWVNPFPATLLEKAP